MTPPAGHGAAAPYRLLSADGRPYDSVEPGRLGGHRRTRVYGRLDCPAARRALARGGYAAALEGGGYAASRVFFADEATARAAGYRPCAVCLPEPYARWRATQSRTTVVPPPA